MTRVGFHCATLALVLAWDCLSALAQVHGFEEVFAQGTAQLRAHEYSKAEDSFRVATKMRPAFAPAYLNLGLALSQQNKQADAVKAFQASVKFSPRLHGASLFLGIALFRINDYDRAIKAFKNATSVDPKDAQGWMWLGLSYLSAGQTDPAAAALDKAGAIDPSDIRIVYHRGRAHMLLAQHLYQEMFNADHEFWGVHEVLGQSYEEQGKDREAADEYLKGINLAPAELGLHELYADVEWRLNELPKATESYTHEISLDPYNGEVYLKLGAVNVLQQNPQEAAVSLQRALELTPNAYEAHFWMARARELLGSDEDAIDQYSKAAQLAPTDDYEGLQSTWYHLAHLYGMQHRTNERKAALSEFEKYKNLAAQKRAGGIQRKRASQLGMDDSGSHN